MTLDADTVEACVAHLTAEARRLDAVAVGGSADARKADVGSHWLRITAKRLERLEADERRKQTNRETRAAKRVKAMRGGLR